MGKGFSIKGNLLNIKFNSEPVCGNVDNYIKTKIKIYGDRVNTKFQGQNVPKCFI